MKMEGNNVLVDVKNTGNLTGAEVLQLYVTFNTAKSGRRSRFLRPLRTLAGFQKTLLEPSQSTTVVMSLDKYSTAVWDVKSDSWCREAGTYTISVVNSGGCLETDLVEEKDNYWNGP